jgi:hypothetical protein
MKLRKSLTALAVLGFALAGPALAQHPERPFIIEARGGLYVPTFDVADLADPGPGLGVSFGYFITPDLLVFGEADFGFHSGAEISEGFMAKAGYVVYASRDGKLRLLVNAGAGALSFEPDVEAAESNTYLAVNAGAKLYYQFHRAVGLVVSPQGDIAFVDEDDGFTGSTAWVWPFSAGFYLSF